MSAVNPPSPHAIAWPDPQRAQAFGLWLQALVQQWGIVPDSLRAASADASFRRYFRVDLAQPRAAAPGHDSVSSLIIMDAPPQHEDCRPFVTIGKGLEAAGLLVPHIWAWDEAQGFMLLSDLGSHTLLSTLAGQALDAEPTRQRYLAAIEALQRLQALPRWPDLPAYGEALLQKEMDLFGQWYLTQLRGQSVDAGLKASLQQICSRITETVVAQPQVLVHRDFHSRNLMVDPQRPQAQVGLLDFQDAVWGPVTYDLVSLLRDAYVSLEEATQIDYAVRYWEGARRLGLPVQGDFGAFWRDFEWMGLQRHLKVLGIFARLALRDGKTQYLGDIPRVWAHAHRVAARYQGLGPLARCLEQAERDHGGTQIEVGYTF